MQLNPADSTQPAHEPSPYNLPQHVTKMLQGSSPWGPSTPAGEKIALPGDSSFQGSILALRRCSFRRGAARQSSSPGPQRFTAGPGAVSPVRHGPSRAPLGPYLLLHVGIAERHGGGGDSDGDSDGDSGGDSGSRRPQETRPVPSVAASGIRSGSCHRRGGAGTRPTHRAAGPMGKLRVCDVTPPYMARRACVTVTRSRELRLARRDLACKALRWLCVGSALRCPWRDKPRDAGSSRTRGAEGRP
ncbi:uncharacterized protein LOC120751725 [Hirundo rustica]|uniref:uncharacterized protein LOC120751725 n=1 Tax=Hirundo rustica TaxID=43150 RepID=UPI001A951B2C|nr:uncharacterized protein LOC120751725 [Hirundo rustica]